MEPHPNEPSPEALFWEFVRNSAASEPAEEPVLVRDEMDRLGWLPQRNSCASDAELPNAIERIVLDLAWLHVYVQHTHHLNDRELYEFLMELIFEHDLETWPEDPYFASVVSALEGDPYGWETYLRYYEGEDCRRYLHREAPPEQHPAKEEPPFPRDWIPTRPA